MPFKKGSDVNASEKLNGRTPLHLAIQMRNIDLAILLQHYGAVAAKTDLSHLHPFNYCHDEDGIKYNKRNR